MTVAADDAATIMEQRILVERMRMMWANAAGSIPAAFVLISFLIVTFGAFSGFTAMPQLFAWGAFVLVMRLTGILRARYYLGRRTTFAELRAQTREAIVASALSGFAWGLLSWAVPPTPDPADDVLVIAILAGVLSSSMAVMAPVRQAYLTFLACLLLPLAAQTLIGATPGHYVLAVGCVIYVVGLYTQAGVMGRAAHSAIELRFQNQALVEKLGVEVENARGAQREAAAANTAKSKFLAAASHDLRQPVHALGLFLEVLGRGPLSLAQRQVLSSARKASEASAEMLNTLLDFSRIEAGVVEPQRKAFALQPLLNKIENELAPQADAKSITYRSRETDVVVWSDPALVDLILRNFVSNAIRYTHRGGVLVGCRRRGGEAVIEVWDTGIGIAQDHQADVFREFHQLGNAERDRRNGLGLGLSIAFGLARTLGHRLSLSSEPERGSVFRLTVPVSDAPPAALERPASGAGEGRVFPRTRVLVIDDDDAVRMGMVGLLTDWGFECDAVESIEAALALARTRPPGLVISDYRLRGAETGAEAIIALRAAVGWPLPALLVTGDTAPERLREARATGVALLHKPVAPADLHRRLVEVLIPANEPGRAAAP